MPRVDNEKTEDLTREELARLWEAIEADSNIQAAGVMKAALFTGMRRGELFKLTWSDLDFQRGFIRISVVCIESALLSSFVETVLRETVYR